MGLRGSAARRCTGAMALLWALAGAPAGAATISLEASAKCHDGGVKDSEGGPGVPVANCSWSVAQGGLFPRSGTVTGSAEARIGYRAVGVTASAQASLTTKLTSDFGTDVTASSHLEDFFFMTATLPDGTPVSNGYMQINAIATGEVHLNTSGAGYLSTVQLDYLLSVGGFSVASNSIYMLDGDPPQQIVQPFAVVVPWQAGLAVPIIMQANAVVDAVLFDDGSVDALAQFGNSLDWLGISNVTDAGGNPVASFTALSADGSVDWGAAAVVPLPAAGWLFASGLVALLGLMGRRRAAQG